MTSEGSKEGRKERKKEGKRKGRKEGRKVGTETDADDGSSRLISFCLSNSYGHGGSLGRQCRAASRRVGVKHGKCKI